MNEAKNQDALKTIGEVANDVGVAPHVLRFWESKFSQIKPQKRRGRRYFRSEDVATIRTIKELLYDYGYTIKGVHKFLKGRKNLHQENDNFAPLVNTENNFRYDLFGNLIIENDNTKTPIELGAAEVAKLKQIYKGLCVARNKLNNINNL